VSAALPRLWSCVIHIVWLFAVFTATVSRTQKPASRQE